MEKTTTAIFGVVHSRSAPRSRGRKHGARLAIIETTMMGMRTRMMKTKMRRMTTRVGATIWRRSIEATSKYLA